MQRALADVSVTLPGVSFALAASGCVCVCDEDRGVVFEMPPLYRKQSQGSAVGTSCLSSPLPHPPSSTKDKPAALEFCTILLNFLPEWHGSDPLQVLRKCSWNQ